jgi:hypothetical protein
MASFLQGLITSVKSFQYRRRTEYELYVYIDDGSYISMALIDHNVSTSVSIINYLVHHHNIVHDVVPF